MHAIAVSNEWSNKYTACTLSIQYAIEAAQYVLPSSQIESGSTRPPGEQHTGRLAQEGGRGGVAGAGSCASGRTGPGGRGQRSAPAHMSISWPIAAIRMLAWA